MFETHCSGEAQKVIIVGCRERKRNWRHSAIQEGQPIVERVCYRKNKTRALRERKDVHCANVLECIHE